jgi:hypothetical protein
VLDLAIPGQTKAIGDRAYAADPQRVASLGRAMAEGLMAAGVQPVMKHLPGHGRARQDSHVELPVVKGDITQDLVPFARNADLGWAMTAHVLYPALDPDCPATLSRPIIQGVIRDRIGFDGVLISDDLAMHALSGRPEARAAAAITAGCDLAMHCDGAFAASLAVLRASGRVSATSQARLDAAPPEPERLNRPALTEQLTAVFATLDGHALCDRLIRAGLPAGPVLAVDEAMAAPHTAAREMVTDLGDYRGLGTPIKLSRTPGGTRAAPPKFGQHSQSVLERHGFSAEEIEALTIAGVVLTERK